MTSLKYDFKERILDDGSPELYETLDLPSGMKAEFGFSYSFRPYQDEIILYPHLTVYHKRKKRWPADPTELTGRDGLIPAGWALQILDSVVEFYLDRYETVRVCIEWHDSRRRDVYSKVLGRKGYYFTHWDGGKVLEKVYGGE